MENKKYYIELEVLSPLAVGAGSENDWVKGADYVQKNGKIYVIDLEKAYAAGVDINKLSAALSGNRRDDVAAILASHLEQASSHIFPMPASTSNPIKTFVRSRLFDRPLVPGSSIKGAIRSCLFSQFHGPKTEKGDLKSGELNEAVFGSMKNGSVFTRFIRVSDIIMPETCIVNSKIFNLHKDGDDWVGGWKHDRNRTTDDYDPVGFNTLYECVAPGVKGVGTIDLMGHDFETLCNSGVVQNYEKSKKKLMTDGLSKLFNMVNNTTFNYIQNELDFLEKYPADRSNEIENKLIAILDRIPEGPADYCIMKMAAGSGFHSITGDWQYKDYRQTGVDIRTNKLRYKSRKIAEYRNRLQMMGFVIIRSIPEGGERRYREHIERMIK